ncbi:MAG: hypothetical protein HYR64_06110 [Fimbriimonas ginsengisoli]|uniref:Uncharacterized protein n=1 Tax=Fimbriimonas ginsengisoli TaxID=1005039 RepID=A0A931LSI6_FIMGI|nr:hypothetical protein [Fimbriimonas ginsengisoli]
MLLAAILFQSAKGAADRIRVYIGLPVSIESVRAITRQEAARKARILPDSTIVWETMLRRLRKPDYPLLALPFNNNVRLAALRGSTTIYVDSNGVSSAPYGRQAFDVAGFEGESRRRGSRWKRRDILAEIELANHTGERIVLVDSAGLRVGMAGPHETKRLESPTWLTWFSVASPDGSRLSVVRLSWSTGPKVPHMRSTNVRVLSAGTDSRDKVVRIDVTR